MENLSSVCPLLRASYEFNLTALPNWRLNRCCEATFVARGMSCMLAPPGHFAQARATAAASMRRITAAIRSPRVVTAAALVVVKRPRAPVRPQPQRVIRHGDGDGAASCLCDKSLRRVRSWRARLGDELLKGLVIDSIVEAEEAADACRDVAPVPGGEHALRTTHTSVSSPTIE